MRGGANELVTIKWTAVWQDRRTFALTPAALSPIIPSSSCFNRKGQHVGILALELIPLIPDFGESIATERKKLHPQTRLMLTWDEHIFRQIPGFKERHGGRASKPAFESRPLPEGLEVGAVDVQGDVVFEREDAAGRMRWAPAKDLKEVRIPDSTSRVNRAAMAYIHQLPNDVEVILFWH